MLSIQNPWKLACQESLEPLTCRLKVGTAQPEPQKRHRCEIDVKYIAQPQECGLIFSGMSPDGKLPEIVKVKDHPWFIDVQFHPDLKSKPFAPHPLFADFVRAAVEGARLL